MISNFIKKEWVRAFNVAMSRCHDTDHVGWFKWGIFFPTQGIKLDRVVVHLDP